MRIESIRQNVGMIKIGDKAFDYMTIGEYKAIFKDLVIEKCEYRNETSDNLYIARSRHFKKLKAYDTIPEYRVVLTKRLDKSIVANFDRVK